MPGWLVMASRLRIFSFIAASLFAVVAQAGEIESAARKAGVEPLLVKAVIMTESRGHPWTLNVDGEPFFLDSRDRAIELVRRVQRAPWLVRATAKGQKPVRYFAETSAQARLLASQLPADMVVSIREVDSRMIDIGLMQINLHYHGKAMGSLEQGFDPKWNLEYGSRFLADLVKRHGTVTAAIGYYNASTPSKRRAYTHKIAEAYERLRRSGVRSS